MPTVHPYSLLVYLPLAAVHGGHALVGDVGEDKVEEKGALGGEALLQGRGEGLADEALAVGDGARRLGDDAFGHLQRAVDGTAGRRHLVDDAVGARLGRRDYAAHEDHLQRPRRAGDAGQALRAARTRQDADVHLRQTEAIVSGEAELEAPTHGVAVDGGDRHLGHGAEALEDGVDLARWRGPGGVES